MYSRYHKGNDTTFQLPENYGGVAFSEKRLVGADSAQSTHTLEVAKPSPPPLYNAPSPTAQSRAETPKPPLPHAADAATDHNHVRPLSLLPIGGKAGFPFAHGIGTEELFIIALIILLIIALIIVLILIGLAKRKEKKNAEKEEEPEEIEPIVPDTVDEEEVLEELADEAAEEIADDVAAEGEVQVIDETAESSDNN